MIFIKNTRRQKGNSVGWGKAKLFYTEKCRGYDRVGKPLFCNCKVRANLGYSI